MEPLESNNSSDILPRQGACYIRVSTDKQEELSPDAQKRLILAYAERNHITIPEDYIFIENGISGKNVKKRPEFLRMITLAKSVPKPFDVILVWKFSRFARNREDSIVYKSMLRKEFNIDVISITEDVGDDKISILIEALIEAMDEYYSVNLSEEVVRGMTEKAIRGGYQSGPPLGYRILKPKSPLTIVPEEALIVKAIFEKYVYEKQSPYEIAKYLNDQGCMTTRGGSFDRRSISYILTNPTYMGKIRWNRIESGTNRIKDPNEWVMSEGLHPPIISEELFLAAGRRMENESRRKYQKPVSSCKHWLSGLLYCSSCGKTLTAFCRNDTKSGKKYWNFQCCGYQKGTCRLSHQISEKKLVPVILASLHNQLASNHTSYYYVPAKKLSAGDPSFLLKKQLEKLYQRQERLRQAYLNGTESLDEYQILKDQIAAQIYNMKTAIDKISCSPDQSGNNKADKIKNAYELLISDHITFTQKNRILKSILDKIVYNKTKNELLIYYHGSFHKDDPMGF